MNKEYVEIQLGSVCKLKNGYAFKSSNYQDEGVPVIRISDIRDGMVSGLNAKKVDGQDDLKDYIIENNSILVAMSGATTGKFGIYRSKEKAYQNQRVGKFEITNENLLYNDFLYYQLHALKRQIEKDAYGGAQPNISSKKIEAMKVILFPLPIQRAIVAKIEQLFSELDNGIQNLQQANQKLAVFRQAVLKKAFEGELTKELINRNDEDKIEEVKLGNICSKIGSGSTPKGGKENYKTEGIPLVRSLNIHFNNIKYDNLAFIDDNQAEKLKNVILEENDVLLNITGASIGRVNNAPKDFVGGRVNQHVSIIRPNNELNPFYLKYFLQSPVIQQWIHGENHGATRQALSKTMIENISVPKPSLEEQHRIVQEIESRLSVCDEMEKSIASSLEKAEALRQSILKKRFQENC